MTGGYQIRNFGPVVRPTRDTGMARWGFSIDLAGDVALRAYTAELRAADFQRLDSLARQQHANVFGDSRGDPFPRRRVFNFWDNRCLLTNVSAEPGNACGLDMDHNDFSRIKRGDNRYHVTYLPHNVDTCQQATALLVAWLLWFNHLEAML